MRPENPSWILVEGGRPETIQRAIVEHSESARPEEPARHLVRVFELDEDKYGAVFDPPAPPHAFANLIGWLDDPRMNPGVERALGWLVAPGDGVRYFLAPRRANAGGDALVGVGDQGDWVKVFLPDGSVAPSNERVATLPEPWLPVEDADPVAAFEVVLDGDASFGNPRFVVE